MTEIQLLEDKIKKMELTLENPNVSGDALKAIQESIKKAKAKLAEMKEAPVDKPKLTKADLFVLLDKSYSLNLESVKRLPQKKFNALKKELEEFARTNAYPSPYASTIDAYIYKHIPKKEEQKKTPTKKEVKDNKKDGPTLAYNWKLSSENSKIAPVVLHCQHHFLKVEKEVMVGLKGEGGKTIEVKALKGEYLIFDDKKKLVWVMTPNDFERKCNEKQSLAKHKKDHHAGEGIGKVAKGDQKQIGEPQGELKVHKSRSADAKNTDLKERSSSKPKKKKAVCTLEEANFATRINKVVKFFVQHAKDYQASKSGKKITKIMRTKGEKQSIIIEMVDFEGFLTGLRSLIGRQRKYYTLCIDSFKLTKVDKPKAGSYRLAVGSDQLKRVYTTNGEKQYEVCLKTYRELLGCSLEGKCSEQQKGKWKKLYHECGDLEQKLKHQPAILKNFHKEVRSRIRKGEKYTDAVARVASEIKKEAA